MYSVLIKNYPGSPGSCDCPRLHICEDHKYLQSSLEIRCCKTVLKIGSSLPEEANKT